MKIISTLKYIFIIFISLQVHAGPIEIEAIAKGMSLEVWFHNTGKEDVFLILPAGDEFSYDVRMKNGGMGRVASSIDAQAPIRLKSIAVGQRVYGGKFISKEFKFSRAAINKFTISLSYIVISELKKISKASDLARLPIQDLVAEIHDYQADPFAPYPDDTHPEK